ncbi:transglycosylase domain-containing protein [Bacillus xiapuensis]|uniref:transglycosylase domain-containing protein n=1 Tax=Bacillus xiapuensis TaxID=2014075 RepID=UPI000C23E8C1|nr:transglycosylase domain-containing protein [Bacillus xiapuensis]
MRTVFGYMLVVLFLPVAVLLFYFANEEAHKVRSFDEVVEEKIIIQDVQLPQASKIVDRNGQPYLEIQKPYRIVVDGKQIPPFLKEVFLQSEDKHFYEHSGVDAAAVMRAVLANAKSDKIEQGASTITQQLARNIYLSHERTLVRKLSEVLYAYQLEKRLSKDEILNLYLNTIYFNNNVYGVEAAARFYFQKPVNKLSKAEMAFIATIPNNPNLYDPTRNFENAKKRQERLIDIMAREKIVTAQEAEAIKKEPIKLNVRDRIDKFENYSTYVEAELKDLIAHSDGFAEQMRKASGEQKIQIDHKLNARVEKVLSSGVTVHTALDPAMQNKTTSAVSSVLGYSSAEGAAAVVKNNTREIVALSGGKDFDKTEFNRSFQAYRHPGSTIKPLLDFGPYVETTGAGPNSMISADKYCSRPDYCPQNYGGREYGMVTLQKALANSYNTSALRVFMKAGPETAFSYLKKFDFARLTANDVLPSEHSRALGSFDVGVSTLEMTGAYTSFINGKYVKPRAIQKVTDRQGKVLYEWKDESKRIWSPSTTNTMRTMLSAVIRSGTGKKANPGTAYAGGKTGTSQEVRDLWFAGLTDQYTASVWVGKDQKGNVSHLERYGPQLLIWRRIMQ